MTTTRGIPPAANGLTDFGWIFTLGGLGIALTFGLFSRIAGWGGLVLNLMIWFAAFPPSTNPVIDGEHMAFALSILLLMWIQASNYWGFGDGGEPTFPSGSNSPEPLCHPNRTAFGRAPMCRQVRIRGFRRSGRKFNP